MWPIIAIVITDLCYDFNDYMEKITIAKNKIKK